MGKENNIMITCREATDYVSREEESKLRFRQRLQLRFHLLLCAACKRFKVQNNRIIQAAKKTDDETTLPPAFREKLEEGLK